MLCWKKIKKKIPIQHKYNINVVMLFLAQPKNSSKKKFVKKNCQKVKKIVKRIHQKIRQNKEPQGTSSNTKVDKSSPFARVFSVLRSSARPASGRRA